MYMCDNGSCYVVCLKYYYKSQKHETVSNKIAFPHRKRNTSSAPTTLRTDQRATTYGGQMWHKYAWPIATKLCATS